MLNQAQKANQLHGNTGAYYSSSRTRTKPGPSFQL
jgi:hypothetical protein